MARRGLRGWKVGLAALLMGVPLAFAQAAASGDSPALAAYDVVSVKPVEQGAGVQYTPDGVHTGGPLLMLIKVAYGGFGKLPTDDSVTGLPNWARTENFTVEAKMSPEQVTEFKKLDKDAQETAREAMLRAVLADRFKLKVHREPKQVPDYELVVAKGGLKIKESDTNPDGILGKDKKPLPGSYIGMWKVGQVTAQAYGMEQLANFLASAHLGVDRMVENKTGLTGKYSFKLNWTMDASPGGGTTDGMLKAPAATGDDTGPSIFTALQEQLGLKLQPGTGTIDTVVVDYVERPSAD